MRKKEECDTFCIGQGDGIIRNDQVTNVLAMPFLHVGHLTKSLDYCCRLRLFGQKGSEEGEARRISYLLQPEFFQGGQIPGIVPHDLKNRGNFDVAENPAMAGRFQQILNAFFFIMQSRIYDGACGIVFRPIR